MHGPDLAAAAAQTAGNVHEATGIGGDHHVRAALVDEGSLFLDHGAADAGKAHRKGAAEATTFVEALQREKLKFLYFSQESLRFIGRTQAAQVASHVIGCLARAASADVLHPKHMDQEIRQFMSAASQVFRPAVPDQIVLEQM